MSNYLRLFIMVKRIYISVLIVMLAAQTSYTQSVDTVVSQTQYYYSYEVGLQAVEHAHLLPGHPSPPKTGQYTGTQRDFYLTNNPVLDSLRAWNMVKLPIYNYQTVNDEVVSFTFYEYDVLSSKPLLRKRYEMVSQQPIPYDEFEWPVAHSSGFTLSASDYELVEEYERYDEHGNLLQTKGRDGKVFSRIYDHDNRVIATVDNAAYNDVAYYYRTYSLTNQHNFTDNPDSTRIGNWDLSLSGRLRKQG